MAESSSTPIKDEETEALEKESSTKETTSGWFSNIVTIAKQKSSKTLEFMKRDLTEFKETVQQNTSAALNTTASYIGETISSLNIPNDEMELKEEPADGDAEPEPENEAASERKELIASPGASKDQDVIDYLSKKAKSIFSSIVDVMIPHEYEDDDDICFVKGNKIVSIERGRWDLLIKTIQSDPQTYCHEPEGPPEDYENWLASFNLIDYEYKVQQLLSTEDGDVKSFYDKLVPHSITPDEFWHRYFYKVHQLKQIEFQRLAAKAEEQEKASEASKKEKDNKEKEKVLEKDQATQSPGKKPSKSKEEEMKRAPTTQSSEEDALGDVKQSTGSKVTSEGGSPSSDTTKQSDGSEEWVKTEMGDIVFEAMKKLDTKLKDNPESKSNIEEDEMFYDWDSS